MPLINNDDREAHQKHLANSSNRANQGRTKLDRILPSVANQMVTTVKDTFRQTGAVRRCSKTFQVDEDILFVPLATRDERLSTALAEAFELPTSAFSVEIRATHEATSYLDISVTFTPPLS